MFKIMVLMALYAHCQLPIGIEVEAILNDKITISCIRID
jgi:hypothetical protein